MNRAVFLLAFAAPLVPLRPSSPAVIEVVGPTVLMNSVREMPTVIFDLRAEGRRVPGATRNVAAPVENAAIFALGEAETARVWAQKRGLKSVFVVPPHLIEFEALLDVPQIAPRAAWQRVSRDGWPLFDVSEAVEFADSRLARSQRLDYLGFRRGKLAQLPKNRPFVVACRVGHRSQLVVRQLRRLGYDARNLKGGLWQWQVENLPLEGSLR
jgi:rhodanese-related sulfurtransferase/ribosomal protein S28E/S33